MVFKPGGHIWNYYLFTFQEYYNDVVMSAMAYQITSLMIVYLTVYSGTDQRKYQSSASLAFVRGIHRWPVYSPHKGPVTRNLFPFDDVIMNMRKAIRTFYLRLPYLEMSCSVLTERQDIRITGSPQTAYAKEIPQNQWFSLKISWYR